MPDYPNITIKKKRIVSVQRRHPWIFSGAIQAMDEVGEGDVIRLISPGGDHLATGYYHDGSIAVRILSFEDDKIDQDFWNRKVMAAMSTRRRLGFPSDQTNAFRLVHGEGDGLPGLIVDVYGSVAVIQCHTGGIYRHLNEISEAILGACDFIKAIYNKSGDVAGFPDGQDGFITGEAPEVLIKENGHSFRIDIIEGQKTGFFLDQRDNRDLVGRFAKGCQVLNLYAYTGGFSVYALSAAARRVVSVDISERAINTLEHNVELNGLKEGQEHLSYSRNVHEYIKEVEKEAFDLVILDPPAFAKSQRKRHNAVQAYKRINAAAMKKIKSGGLLFTFSCSQVVDAQLFYDTITAAAMEIGRPVKVLYRLSQGADHPVSIYHPEGEYLKGLVLEIG